MNVVAGTLIEPCRRFANPIGRYGGTNNDARSRRKQMAKANILVVKTVIVLVRATAAKAHTLALGFVLDDDQDDLGVDRINGLSEAGRRLR